MICTWLIAKRKGYGSNTEPFSLARVRHAVWDGKWAIGAPLVILGGIYSGVFTPTEAASVAVVYAAIVGGLFVVEALSVIIQVLYFKKTGKRVFLMAPIHHHFEKRGWGEAQIVIRVWIISVILALIGLATLKLR